MLEFSPGLISCGVAMESSGKRVISPFDGLETVPSSSVGRMAFLEDFGMFPIPLPLLPTMLFRLFPHRLPTLYILTTPV